MITDDVSAKDLFEPAVVFKELSELGDPVTEGDLPTQLPTASIAKKEELFQPRGLDERHIQELRRSIKNQGQLDPVTIMHIGENYVLLDGHHRVTAYELEKVTKAIPVQCFTGSLADAVLEAGSANSKVKLPMSLAERSDYAWKLVLLDKYSKKRISEASGISDRQVANMRAAKKTLGDDAYEYPSWYLASQRARGIEARDLTDEEREDFVEMQASKYADRMQKHFGSKLSNNPEIAARAMEIYFGRTLRDLVSWMSLEPLEDDEEENPDF